MLCNELHLQKTTSMLLGSNQIARRLIVLLFPGGIVLFVQKVAGVGLASLLVRRRQVIVIVDHFGRETSSRVVQTSEFLRWQELQET